MSRGEVDVRAEGDSSFVAAIGDAVVGEVRFGSSGLGERIGTVEQLEVVEAHRRTGIGTALLVAAEDALQAAGFEEAVMWVDQEDEGVQRFLAWHTWSTDGEIREVEGGKTEARFRRLLGF